MKKVVLAGVAVIGMAVLGAAPFQSMVLAQGNAAAPIVFQAAGPTSASIQSMVDAFRTALGGANNGNVAGPLQTGRREINWDGGGATTTAIVATPFNGFLNTRGGRFTTSGTGFAQAPLDGLVSTFNNGSFLTAFQAFSPLRLFTPLGSTFTVNSFFVPGSNGATPATTAAFAAVFSDVDSATSTALQFYGITGNLILTANVPASKGVASFSFVGVQFDSARIASIRIKTGNAAAGPGINDRPERDVVMMDDFIYAEPQEIPSQLLGGLAIPVE